MPSSILTQCLKKRVLRHAQRAEPLHSLVFKPFQCRTLHTDDLAEGFAGFRSSLATDGKDVPFERKCSAIPFLNDLQNVCKGRQHFFFPSLFCCIWFFIYFDLSLHINLEVSLHNLLKRCELVCLSQLSSAPQHSLAKLEVGMVVDGSVTELSRGFVHFSDTGSVPSTGLPLPHHQHVLVDSSVLCR